jgi:hypothetical protein
MLLLQIGCKFEYARKCIHPPLGLIQIDETFLNHSLSSSPYLLNAPKQLSDFVSLPFFAWAHNNASLQFFLFSELLLILLHVKLRN